MGSQGVVTLLSQSVVCEWSQSYTNISCSEPSKFFLQGNSKLDD